MPRALRPVTDLIGQVGSAGTRPLTSALRQLRVTGRTHRRAWVGNGRAHIEVRAVHRPDGQRFARRIERALEGLDGVHWAEVNAVLGRVVVAFDEDATALDDLVGAIAGLEEAHDVATERLPLERAPHPGDPEPLRRNVAALGADVFGLGFSLFGQFLRAAPIPGEVASVVSLADSQPRVRQLLETHLGHPAVDLGLALSSAVAQALAQGPLGLLVDIGHRANLVGEIRARQRAWTQREPELVVERGDGPVGPVEASPRPRGMPRGPIERYADQASLAALGVCGVAVAATRDPRRSANVLLAGVPKAARLGREAFAAQLGRDLAHRRIIVLDPSALRRLDRVDTVVVDGAVLFTDGAVDPLADALLRRVRDAGCTLVLADSDRAVDAQLGADRVVPGGLRLGESVRALQGEGRTVACVSARADAALVSADCGIGVISSSARPPWGADVLCGPGLETACRVVEALAAARAASRHSTLLAAAGSAIGGVGALIGPGRGAAQRGLIPVNGAALLAQAVGTWSAVAVSRRPPALPSDRREWHVMQPDEALAALGSARGGLCPEDAQQRWKTAVASTGGATSSNLASTLAGELANPLTPVLALGAGLSAAVGSVLDAVLVGGVVTANAAISAAQRLRTERALDELTRTTAVRATVCRGGEFVELPADRLVVGDLVRVSEGEVVPADCRMLEAAWCEVDESSLTGESLPVSKDPEPTPGTVVAERRCMLYEGTTVVAGGALALVVATGTATEAGRSVAGVGDPPPSGVERRLQSLTAATAPITVITGAAVGAMSVLRRRPLREAVGSGVSLMVAAVPEGLPLLATVAQQSAAHRLSEHDALVRNPRTIEALGRVDLLCFDKTGTLTEGRIGLQRVSDGFVDEPVDALDPARRSVLAAALRASPPSGNGEILTHATDRAVVEGAADLNVTAGDGIGGWVQREELAFEPARGFHAVLGEDAGGTRVAVKGAPEAVLARCVAHRQADGTRRSLDRRLRRQLEAEVARLAQQGLRVLAVAERPSTGDGAFEEDDIRGLELLGFVALADLVRSTAAEAVRALRRAGVDVAMITGDHPSTAEAIASDLGILNGGRVLSGPDLESLGDADLEKALAEATVFARVTPADKVRIVEGFQRSGRVVAMTGDGANDAPAIRLAHAGVALGRRGTPAARAAADLVVTDDRIETIIDAIVEGRAMWASVRDALAILVGGNLGEVAFTLSGAAVSGRSPLSPRQLLLVNLLTDLLPAMTIALQPPATTSPESLLHEGPEASLGSALARDIALRAVTTAGGATAAWLVGRGTGRPARARTIGLVALVGTQMGQTIVAGRRSPVVIGSALVSAGLLVPIVQIPPVSRFFGCTPLGPVGWATALGSASAATVASVALPWAWSAVPHPLRRRPAESVTTESGEGDEQDHAVSQARRPSRPRRAGPRRERSPRARLAV